VSTQGWHPREPGDPHWVYGQPYAAAGELDPDKTSVQWWLAASEGPSWVYNWLPATGYQPPETTTHWHIGGSRMEVVSCVADALNVSAHIHRYDPRQKRVIDTKVPVHHQV
jgi:hypothetical protein